jgi:hypothetical protein
VLAIGSLCRRPGISRLDLERSRRGLTAFGLTFRPGTASLPLSRMASFWRSRFGFLSEGPVDVLELVHPGKPQGREKTTCALASGVGIGLPRSGRAVQFQVPLSR